MLKGLPASGKSTYAKELVEKQGYKRLNKDDIREMVDCSKWSKENEELVVNCRNTMLINFLQAGKNVVIDDTNFEQKHMDAIRVIMDAENSYIQNPNHRYVLEEKFFDTDVDECIKRDAQRAKSVGAKVIRGMYEKYLKPKNDYYNPDKTLPKAIVCDLDGTLALLNGRSPYEPETVLTDTVNEPVAKIIRVMCYADDYEVIFVSGRFEKYRKETLQWLSKNYLPNKTLFMRADMDMRKDAVIKKEIFEANIRPKYNVHFVLDDRNQVVEMWRSLGLTCLQVADGNF